MQTLEYKSVGTSDRRAPNRRTAACALSVVCVVVAANAVLIYWAAKDRSWGAMGIMIMIGPLVNAAIALVSVALFPLVRRVSLGAIVSPYIVTSIVVPIAAIIVDAVCILSMGLHGC